MTRRIWRWAAVLSLGGIVLGCGTVAERRMEYKKAETLAPLEVPPDLLALDTSDTLALATAPLAGTATMSEYSRGQDGGAASKPEASGSVTTEPAVGVLEADNVKLMRDGAQRWLQVHMNSSELWAKLKAFLVSNGLPVKREDSRIGLIETDWAENRGQVPLTSLWEKAFSALHSSSTQDQYIVRVEPGNEPNVSQVFISHRGLQQVEKNESTSWLPRPSESWLEAELMARLALTLGVSEGQAQRIATDGATGQQIAAVKHGPQESVWLELDLDFARAWARMASAIARTTIVIEDFDRQKGLFYVAGVLPAEVDVNAGWWARTFRGYVEEDPKEFRIKLENIDASTRATILTKDGTPDYSKRAELLLEQLKAQLQ